MIFTKLEHSGCIIENNGHKVVCDPVEIEAKIPELENVDAIIITHKHGDHFQPEVLERIIAKNPGARIFAPKDLEISEIAEHVIEKVEADVEWNLENFDLKFFSKNHAPIVPEKTPCANLGVMINDKIVNPGDSFDLPDGVTKPGILLVPSSAPWCKVYEGMEYIKTSQPKIAVPVHNAVLSNFGNNINNNWLKLACEEVGAELATLGVNDSIEI